MASPFLVPAVFIVVVVVVVVFAWRDLTLPSSHLFQFGPYVENSCVMLHYVFIHTRTLTETFTMPLGLYIAALVPLYFYFIWLFVQSSVTVDGMRCCFVCWQREWQCVAAVLCCELVGDASHCHAQHFFFFCGIIGCDSVWYFSVIVPCLFLMGGGLQRRHCLNCAPNSQSTLSRNRSQPSLQFQAKHKSERDKEQRREGDRKKQLIYRPIFDIVQKGKDRKSVV